MFRRLLLLLVPLLALLTLATAPASAAAGPPSTCTSSLLIFTDPTALGVVRQTGQVTHIQDSGVLGTYTSGLLAGYTIVGTQDIQINAVTQVSQLHGQFVASGPDGSTITLRYTGQADLKTGQARGSFVASDGTGRLSALRWSGQITAQLIGPLTFVATDTGPCSGAPTS